MVRDVTCDSGQDFIGDQETRVSLMVGRLEPEDTVVRQRLLGHAKIGKTKKTQVLMANSTSVDCWMIVGMSRRLCNKDRTCYSFGVAHCHHGVTVSARVWRVPNPSNSAETMTSWAGEALYHGGELRKSYLLIISKILMVGPTHNCSFLQKTLPIPPSFSRQSSSKPMPLFSLEENRFFFLLYQGSESGIIQVVRLFRDDQDAGCV